MLAGLSALRGSRPLFKSPVLSKNNSGNSQYLAEVTRLQREVGKLEAELAQLRNRRFESKLLSVTVKPEITPDEVKVKLRDFWTGHNGPVVLYRSCVSFALHQEGSAEFLYWLILDLEQSGPIDVRLEHDYKSYPDTASVKAYLEDKLAI